MNLHEKRISAFFMAALMVLSACVVPFFANGVEGSWLGDLRPEDIVASGVDGDVYWYVESSRGEYKYTLRIEPVEDNQSAKMYDYQPVGSDIAPWRNCGFNIDRVFIDDYAGAKEFSLTNIGDYAFYGMTSIKYVGISKHINDIGEGAFKGCTKLESVNSPEQTIHSRGYGIYIDDYAFQNCKKLNVQGDEEISHLLKRAEYVGEYAFDGCENLTGSKIMGTLEIGSMLTEIGIHAFDDCNVHKYSVAKGNDYFRSDKDGVLMSHDRDRIVRCPETYGRFEGSTFTIGSNVKYIDEGAFDGCNHINMFEVESGNRYFKTYEGILYQQDRDSLELFRCPEGYGRGATDPVTAVINPDWFIDSVNKCAFDGCEYVNSIEYKAKMRPVGETKTYWTDANGVLLCTDYVGGQQIFEVVRCPEGYQKSYIITDNADADTPISILCDHAFYNVQDAEIRLITCTKGGTSVLTTIGDYALSRCYYDWDSTYGPLPDTVVKIGDYAFAESMQVRFGYGDFTLYIGDTITSIGEGAFYRSTAIKSVVIQNRGGPQATDEIKIGAYAFYGCTNLESLSISRNTTVNIGDYAFYGCSKLSNPEATTPGSLDVRSGMVIGKHAFGGTGFTSLDIHTDVTSIGDYAFDGCANLTGTLTISSETEEGVTVGVVSIGQFAFAGTGYTALDLTNAKVLTSIGMYAFYNTPIASVTIPASVVSIGEGAFCDCDKLTSLDLTGATGLKSIGKYAFSGCVKLQKYEFVLPVNTVLESIGDYAFYGCNLTGKITIPASVATIGTGAFYKQGITGVTINAEGYIGDYAFYKCGSLTSITISKGVKAIGYCAFAYCNSNALDYVSIPSSVVYISDGAFAYCDGIEKLVLSEATSLSYIGDGAFYECTNLGNGQEMVKFPDSLKSIGSEAFFGCEGLKGTLELKNVSSVGNYAFTGCHGITAIKFTDEKPITLGDFAFADCTGLIELNLSNYVKIGESTFGGCDNITILKIDSEKIGKEAFKDCGAIRFLEFGDNVKTIGDNAFYNCESLERVTLGSNITTIGNGAFYNCIYLAGALVIPDNVKTIGQYAFAECSLLNSLTLGSNVEIIGDHAFDNCTSLDGSLYIGNKVTTIGASAFYNCSGIDGLVLGNSVRTIGDNAFYGCSGLKGTLTIGDSIVSIGDFAFYKCAQITNLTLGSGLKSIGNGAFGQCENLTGQIEIPKNTSKVGYDAFFNTGVTRFTVESGNSAYIASPEGYLLTAGGYELVSCPPGMTGQFTIPEGVTRIAPYAFYHVRGLTGELVLPESVTFIGTNAFSGCTGLTSVTITSDRIDFSKGYNFTDCKNLTEIKILSAVVVSPVVASNADVLVFDKLYDRAGTEIKQTAENLAQSHFAKNAEGKMTEGKKLAKINFVPVAHGSVDATTLTAEFGSQVMVDGNVIMINGQKITAKADEGYKFVGWFINGQLIPDGPGMVHGSANIVPVFEKIEPVPPGPGPVPPGPVPPQPAAPDYTGVIICLSIIAAIAAIGVVAYIARIRK